MATSLLRLGRLGSLKGIQQDVWGFLRTPLTAAFCTKAQAPKKPAKKAASKTFEASDDRAALLAYKTTVDFPTRLSTPGFLSQGFALSEHKQSRDPMTGESAVAAGGVNAAPAQVSSDETVTAVDAKQAKSVTPDSAKAKTESCAVDAAEDVTPVSQTATEKDVTSQTSADVQAPKSDVAPKDDDDDDTSSSSSSSDSDSDSDSDDEKPHTNEMTKPVRQTEDKARQEETSSALDEEPTSSVKTRAVPERVQPSTPEGTPKEIHSVVTEPAYKKVPAPRKATASSVKSADPAPVLRTAKSVKAQVEVKPRKEAGIQVKSSHVSDSEPLTEGVPDITADSATKVASKPQTKAALKTTEAVAVAEELVDPAPVITDAEEVRAQPDVTAAPQEAAAAPAAAAPEPEPFDNTTYKNLQHHTYNTFTFVDMDVEMAKHRLPQPSSGRPSPMH